MFDFVKFEKVQSTKFNEKISSFKYSLVRQFDVSLCLYTQPSKIKPKIKKHRPTFISTSFVFQLKLGVSGKGVSICEKW